MAAKNKSPEELLEELVQKEEQFNEETKQREAQKTALMAEIKSAKLKSISQAVGAAGGDFEKIFQLFQTHKNAATQKENQISKLREDIKKDLEYVHDQYKNVRDTLVGLKVKEEYLAEFIGEPPAAYVAKVAGSGAGKTRTALLIDGVKMSSVEASKKYGITIHEGANQRPFAEAGLKEKGIAYKVVVAATGAEIKA